MKTKLRDKLPHLTRISIQHLLHHPAAQIAFLSFTLLLFVESFSRESFFRAVAALCTQPYFTLYNMLLIAITLTPALFFTRRYFVYIVVSLLWVIAGITDFVLLQFRTTPFTFVDITMIRSAITIWDHYLTVWQLVLIAIALLAAIVGCTILFLKIRRAAKLPLLRVASVLLIMVAGAIVSTDLGVRMDVLSRNFGNLADAYHLYGLPYCFVSSVINTGISKPKKYSDEYVQQIIDAIESGSLVSSVKPEPTLPPPPSTQPTGAPDEALPSEAPVTVIPTDPSLAPSAPPVENDNHNPSIPDTPNVIFVQLESFFDPTTILGVDYSEDPIPNFHRLSEQYSSGFLRVPSIGAGTANTEFEVITGMNLDFFGPGEYPYKTILLETTCESAAYIFKSLGYGTHAIHNNDGTFYGRHEVFPNLGFDSFTSIEYMQHVERTPLNWAKDRILVDEIQKAMESTDSPDYIYTISVQGHGSYPSEELLKHPPIDLTLPETLPEDMYYPLLYYTNQLNEMDLFVEELVQFLSACGEDTVLVLYGDHLPGFKFTENDIEGGDLFRTPYIIWSNFALPAENRTLEAYQLYSYVMERLGISDGILNAFHQTQKNSEQYLEDLEVLEYDILYGNKQAYGGENPYQPTDMQMGISPIHLTSIQAFADSSSSGDKTDGQDKESSFPFPFGQKDEKIYTVFLLGYGFTPYSFVQVNGKPASTMFLSGNVLSAIMPLPEEGDEITVVQQGTDEQILSTSNTLVVTEEILREIFPEKNPSLEGED